MAKDDNKRKWEKDYEKYQTMNLDEEIKKLEEDVKGLRVSQAGIKDTTSKEYKDGKSSQKDKEKELNKMKALKQNLPKVKNVMELKSKLTEKMKTLNEQKKEVEATKKLGEEGKKLEDELAKLIEREAKIKEELKDSKLPEDKRAKLQEELGKNAIEQKDNHMKFSKNQLDLTEKLNSPLQKKNFDKEIQTTKNMISKCNFIGRNLMEGKRMEEITVDLNKWENRKFVDKNGTVKDKKEKIEKTEKTTEPGKETKPERAEEPKKSEPENIEEYEKAVANKIEKEDNTPLEVSEFDQKHPRIAKVKNFFKNMGSKAKVAYEKVKDKVTKKEEKKEEVAKGGSTAKIEEKSHKEVEGALSKEEIENRKAKFYKRMAEQGKVADLPKGNISEAISKQEQTIKDMQDEGR